MVESQRSASASKAPEQAAPPDRRHRNRSGDPRKRNADRPDARKKRQRLVGKTTPRIYTPPLVTGPAGPCGCGCALTDATTRGFSVVEFAEQILKIHLRPWQRWLLIHALETLPDGTFRFRNIVVLVARQNGKSTLSIVLALWAMYARGVRVVLSAAQDLDTAEEIWQTGVDLVEETDEDEQPVRPELWELKENVVLVNGKKALILETGERWKVKAANRKAGRGLSGDLIILDELREQQNWHAWSAITKTTMARPLALVWCFSNAGDITSVVLRHLRVMAHRKLGDPDGIVADEDARLAGAGTSATAPDEFDVEQIREDDPELADLELDDLEVDVDDLFLAEWSAQPGASKWDRAGWEQANPSLGYGDITERAIASACGIDPEWEFRTEVLCQWPEGVLEGMFEAGTWEDCRNAPLVLPSGREVIRQADKIVGKSWLCIDQSQDASWAYVARVGRSADGRWQGEVIAAQRGTDWLKPWLLERVDGIVAVCAQGRGAPISGWLNDAMTDPKLVRVRFVRWEGADLIPGHLAGFAAVRDGQLWHNKQPTLDTAAERGKVNELVGGRVIDRLKSPVDVAPLIALFGAWWLSQRPARRPAAPPAPALVKSNTSADRATLPDFLRLEPGLGV